MIERIINKTSVPLMEKVLNITSLRQKTIASNISNAQTPGFRQKEVNFEASLKEAKRVSSLQGQQEHDRHMPMGKLNKKSSAVVGERSVNASIEKEMALSAENQLLYSAAVRILSGNVKAMRASIRGHF